MGYSMAYTARKLYPSYSIIQSTYIGWINIHRMNRPSPEEAEFQVLVPPVGLPASATTRGVAESPILVLKTANNIESSRTLDAYNMNLSVYRIYIEESQSINHTSLYIHILICMCINIYISIYIYMYLYIYMYININLQYDWICIICVQLCVQ